jgi:putative ABC transport system substrate-binding protein
MPGAAAAQRGGGRARLGFVDLRDSNTASHIVRGLRDALRDLGYVEGQTVVVEYRFAEGEPARLPAILAELLRLKVDVLLTVGTVVTQAAQRATATVPIVMTTGNPVGSGLVKSLARPGGNITGLSLYEGAEFQAKRLQLLKEAAPGVTRVGYIWNPRDRTVIPEPLQRAADTLQVKLAPFDVRTARDFDVVFRRIRDQHVDALMTDNDPLITGAARRIADFAATHRLPGMSGSPRFVDAGGLMSYGTSTYELWRQGAKYVDRILKGAKPADLPIERPTKFELVINLTTAKSLGLTIPGDMLARADRVIR